MKNTHNISEARLCRLQSSPEAGGFMPHLPGIEAALPDFTRGMLSRIDGPRSPVNTFNNAQPNANPVQSEGVNTAANSLLKQFGLNDSSVKKHMPMLIAAFTLLGMADMLSRGGRESDRKYDVEMMRLASDPNSLGSQLKLWEREHRRDDNKAARKSRLEQELKTTPYATLRKQKQDAITKASDDIDSKTPTSIARRDNGKTDRIENKMDLEALDRIHSKKTIVANKLQEVIPRYVEEDVRTGVTPQDLQGAQISLDDHLNVVLSGIPAELQTKNGGTVKMGMSYYGSTIGSTNLQWNYINGQWRLGNEAGVAEGILRNDVSDYIN